MSLPLLDRGGDLTRHGGWGDLTTRQATGGGGAQVQSCVEASRSCSKQPVYSLEPFLPVYFRIRTPVGRNEKEGVSVSPDYTASLL